MTYTPEWEPIAAALKRVMATGMTESEAKDQLCCAIADGKIVVRLHLAADLNRGLQEEAVGSDIRLPSRFSPRDVDCQTSRLSNPWPIVRRHPGETVIMFGARVGHLLDRTIEVIELRVSDVSKIFCRPVNKPDAQPAPGLPKRRSGAGAKSSGITQAIAELWPEGIPEGLSAKDRNNKIIEYLRARSLSVPNNPERAIQRVIRRLALTKQLSRC